MKSKPVSHNTTPVHWIAKFLREERVAQGKTQEQISKAANMPHGSVSNYETGYYSIRAVNTIERMLKVLGYKLYIKKI